MLAAVIIFSALAIVLYLCLKIRNEELLHIVPEDDMAQARRAAELGLDPEDQEGGNRITN